MDKMNLVSFALKHGYKISTVEAALKFAIEDIFRRVHGIPSVEASIDLKTLSVIYNTPLDISITDAMAYNEKLLEGDLFSVEFDLSKFPPDFIRLTKNCFAETLADYHAIDCYEDRVKRLNTVIDGEIISIDNKTIEIIYGDNKKASMPRHLQVPSEYEIYKKKTTMKFLIADIILNPYAVIVSRCSKKLPEKLLKEKLPWFEFVCDKRYIGHKSIIRTNAPFDSNFRKIRTDISLELNNEILETIPF